MLDELVKRHGWTSAASRVAREPEQFGELRGKEGFFAGAKARAERDAAQRAIGGTERSMKRIGESEAQAVRTYRTSVEGQRAADGTGIPRLSAKAEVAIGAIAAAKDDQVRGKAWRALQKDGPVAAELDAFKGAVAERFGDEGVRAMLRARGQPGAVASASVLPQQQPALDRVAWLTATLRQGEWAGATLAQRQAESERQGQRRGMRM